jgi:hypothetical protein
MYEILFFSKFVNLFLKIFSPKMLQYFYLIYERLAKNIDRYSIFSTLLYGIISIINCKNEISMKIQD